MTTMDYAPVIEYLLSYADFERTGRFQAREDVAPMLALLKRLGDPHLGRLTVHVAGSKGKGSVSAMIESMLRAFGLRTGLYTSPHLHEYTERIRINGEPVSEGDFARLVEAVRPAAEESQAQGPGPIVTFDLLTAMGFLAFREADVDVQVIEVGLGGRVDQTNVFETKEVAVITPLSFEHTSILGDTIEQIAAEKAAIITPGCTAVMAPQRYPEAGAVVREFAVKAGVRLVDVANEYRWSVGERDVGGQMVRVEAAAVGNLKVAPTGLAFRLPLLGEFQAENAATAIAAVDALEPRLDNLGYAVDEGDIVRGLEAVLWPGRMEVLRERPLVVADGAHNAESARRLREALVEHFGAKDVTFIIGSGGDKDIAGLARELGPIAGRVIAAKTAHPRAMEPRFICEAFAALNVPYEDVDSVTTAIQIAMDATDERGLICLAGSLFVAAEARDYFHKQTIEPAGGVHGG
jgi:dihydrofolate synthase/folylpolyglutamate synthase